MLRDPITSMPVIIVEKEVLKEILPNTILDNLNQIIGGDVPKEIYEDKNIKYITKFRVIPFTSLGKQNGLLLGFKSNKIIINKEQEEKKVDDVIIGIYDNKLSKRDQYSALVGLDIIEGSDKNEFIKNISG